MKCHWNKDVLCKGAHEKESWKSQPSFIELNSHNMYFIDSQSKVYIQNSEKFCPTAVSNTKVLQNNNSGWRFLYIYYPLQ